jgi:hypothetical protein
MKFFFSFIILVSLGWLFISSLEYTQEEYDAVLLEYYTETIVEDYDDYKSLITQQEKIEDASYPIATYSYNDTGLFSSKLKYSVSFKDF